MSDDQVIKDIARAHCSRWGCGGRSDLILMVAGAITAERERCAKIADDRATGDRQLYQNETDWRMPYAFNRVVRASMDIAAAIRNSAAPIAGQREGQT